KVPVAPDARERELEREVRAAAAASGLGGGVLASLLRRLGSSPPALAAGLQASSDRALSSLAKRAAAIAPESDSKLRAFRELLDGPLAGEKVLVFAEARDTIEYLPVPPARSEGRRPA